MASPIKEAYVLVKKSCDEFFQDDCMTMGGALAFYTIFSLPPILIVIITIAGWFIGTGEAKQQVMEQAKTQMGPEAAQQLETVQTQQQGTGTLATVLGALALIFGATGIMAQLQSAMDKAWEVKPDPQRGVIKNFAIKRALSFVMILVIALLLLASMVLSALLNGFGATISQQTGVSIPGPLWAVVNELVSLLVIALLFATIFKVLPDVKIAWRDVWVGAAVTSLLFVIGKYLLGFYLGRTGVASAYGAAGSLVLLLVWVYYSSLIFLFGVEFTQVWTRRHGSEIRPAAGAVAARREGKSVSEHKG